MLKYAIGIQLILIVFLSLMVWEPNHISVNQSKMDSAAVQVLDRINPVSMHENFEYVGLITVTSSRYLATEPVTDRSTHEARVPKWYNSIYTGYVLATYHTHAATSKQYDDCNFSPIDTAKIKHYAYVATPCGTIMKFNYHDRKVYKYDRSVDRWYQVRPDDAE